MVWFDMFAMKRCQFKFADSLRKVSTLNINNKWIFPIIINKRNCFNLCVIMQEKHTNTQNAEHRNAWGVANSISYTYNIILVGSLYYQLWSDITSIVCVGFCIFYILSVSLASFSPDSVFLNVGHPANFITHSASSPPLWRQL